jgi:hypothetical protein
MGVILDVAHHGDAIVPNTAHPIVQTFYRNKTGPQKMNKKMVVRKAAQTPSVGQVTLKLVPQLSKPVMVPTILPRRQNKGGPVTPHTAIRSRADTTRLYNAQTKMAADTTSTRDDIEDRLQELEEEILKLKMENIVKDREIRKLKSENKQLRGIENEPGSKRQRV